MLSYVVDVTVIVHKINCLIIQIPAIIGSIPLRHPTVIHTHQ